jgi:hypothetical protein
MSLNTFVKLPEVREKLKPFRPKISRFSVPLMVSPRSKRYMLVGRAFDYLLRFELQRRAPHAVSSPWVAELAPDRIGRVRGGFDLEGNGEWIEAEIEGTFPRLYPDMGLAEEVANRARKVLDAAKVEQANYLMYKSPTREDQADLAAHAIRLAKLDDVSRKSRLDPRFEVANQDDVEDLLDMLAIVPWGTCLPSP